MCRTGEQLCWKVATEVRTLVSKCSENVGPLRHQWWTLAIDTAENITNIPGCDLRRCSSPLFLAPFFSPVGIELQNTCWKDKLQSSSRIILRFILTPPKSSWSLWAVRFPWWFELPRDLNATEICRRWQLSPSLLCYGFSCLNLYIFYICHDHVLLWWGWTWVHI